MGNVFIFYFLPPLGSALLLNDGAGAFSPGAPLPVPPGTMTWVLGNPDFDGDGVPDLFVGTEKGLIGLENDGNAVFARTFEIDLGITPLHAEYVDVDADGDGDVLVATGTELRVFEQTAPLVFTENFPDHDVGCSIDFFAIGDIDGDGDPDHYVGGDRFYVNDGTGYFELDTSRRVGAWTPPAGVRAFLDMDGDGDLDLLAGDQTSMLLENDGFGFFSVPAASSLPTLPRQPLWLEVADLSGDGLDDVVVGCNAGISFGEVAVWENTGAGTFVARAHTIAPSSSSSSSIDRLSVGDVDGDSHPDVLVANGIWRLTAWTTADPLVFAPVSVPANFRAEVLVDVDHDGDLDALTGGGAYLNEGYGVFADLGAPRTGTCWAACDLDGDGDVDSLVSEGRGAFWEENDGNGGFTLGGGTDPADGGTRPLSYCRIDQRPETYAPVLFDADLDGDPDLAWGERAFHVFANLTRGLYVQGVPGIGRHLELDVYGPPNTPWLLGFAEATRERNLPMGRSLLKFSTWIEPLFRMGVVDTSGRTRVKYWVRADPTLLGRSFVTQALVDSPLYFTNADWFTLTDG